MGFAAGIEMGQFSHGFAVSAQVKVPASIIRAASLS